MYFLYKFKRLDTRTNIAYTKKSDYYYSDLVYSKNDYPPLGKYGMLRKTFLLEHRKALFSKMLLCDELWPHLLEVDEQAHTMVETMVTDGNNRGRNRIAEIDRPAVLGWADEQLQKRCGGTGVERSGIWIKHLANRKAAIRLSRGCFAARFMGSDRKSARFSTKSRFSPGFCAS